MRTLLLFGFLSLSAAGCGGGPVSEDEFAAFVGKPISEAERRIGPPDIVKNDWVIWEDRVRGPAGLIHSRAALRVDAATGKVDNHGIVYRE